MSDYQTFLAGKRQHAGADGFAVDAGDLHPALYPWQAELVAWALGTARAALFEDCGLGKTPQQLVWSDTVARRTNGNILILTPLAVAHQTVAEAEKFGIAASRSDDGTAHPGITVTNYERLHLFDPDDFVGCVCDESGRLKAFDGVTRNRVTAFLRRMRYRLLASATPAPNDYIELGTSSEALGYLGYVDMLNRFFVNDRNNSSVGRAYGKQVEWRFKGHAEEPFWRWVCAWARAIRRPSDMGYDDGAFVLPPLIQQQHVVETSSAPPGMLFPVEAISLHEQRAERRRTLDARCEYVAALVNHDQPALVWCHLNDEGDALERTIPGAVQVAGHESDNDKEEKLLAFARGEARVLVTKPVIAGWGLNWQHCAHMTFFPSHSFEQFYQGVRRCWRYGQTRPVVVDVVTTAGERRVLANLERKAVQAEAMFARLVALMHEGQQITRHDGFTREVTVPAWL